MVPFSSGAAFLALKNTKKKKKKKKKKKRIRRKKKNKRLYLICVHQAHVI
jgi:hypothetical protein